MAGAMGRIGIWRKCGAFLFHKDRNGGAFGMVRLSRGKRREGEGEALRDDVEGFDWVC